MANPIVKNKGGFSIIEVMVVIAILAILLGASLFLSLDFYRDYSSRSEANLVISLLQKARNQSMANINSSPHGLYFDSGAGNYVLFQGIDYTSRDPDEDVAFEMSDNVTHAGDSEVVFDQLTGRTSPAALSITRDARTTNISINDEGRINW